MKTCGEWRHIYTYSLNSELYANEFEVLVLIALRLELRLSKHDRECFRAGLNVMVKNNLSRLLRCKVLYLRHAPWNIVTILNELSWILGSCIRTQRVHYLGRSQNYGKRKPASSRLYACLSVVWCQVEVSASGWSLVQRSLTECGVSECDLKNSTMRRRGPSRGCCAM
jgi:hypothetical protein